MWWSLLCACGEVSVALDCAVALGPPLCVLVACRSCDRGGLLRVAILRVAAALARGRGCGVCPAAGLVVATPDWPNILPGVLKLRWGALVCGAALLFVLLVVPVAMPQSVEAAASSGPMLLVRGLGDGLAAVALGWKQLLTLTLPLGSFTRPNDSCRLITLVYVVVAVSAALAVRGGRAAVARGASMLSACRCLDGVGSSACGEAACVWGGAALAAHVNSAVWIAGTLSLRRCGSRGFLCAAPCRVASWQAGCGLGVAAGGCRLRNRLALGHEVLWLLPLRRAWRVDPELVVREQVSPLAQFRRAKQDAGFVAPWFEVQGVTGLPSRLRIAVLDGYDGVDFFVGDPSGAGRFTRFPSGGSVADPVRVRVTIADGYRVAPPASVLGAEPAEQRSLVDFETVPQLKRWLDAQQLQANGEGLSTAVQRLRDRGYLSHSLTDGTGERAWLDALASDTPIQFAPSPGDTPPPPSSSYFCSSSSQQEKPLRLKSERRAACRGPSVMTNSSPPPQPHRARQCSSPPWLSGVRLADAETASQGRCSPVCPPAQKWCTGANLTAWVEAARLLTVVCGHPQTCHPGWSVPPMLAAKRRTSCREFQRLLRSGTQRERSARRHRKPAEQQGRTPES
ncbi:hypothetical protein FQR65_LT20221 [Abscondita terminalis]|nr:hypothetical protein FQR65_LT20221 [Abscondita terminalis]